MGIRTVILDIFLGKHDSQQSAPHKNQSSLAGRFKTARQSEETQPMQSHNDGSAKKTKKSLVNFLQKLQGKDRSSDHIDPSKVVATHLTTEEKKSFIIENCKQEFAKALEEYIGKNNKPNIVKEALRQNTMAGIMSEVHEKILAAFASLDLEDRENKLGLLEIGTERLEELASSYKCELTDKENFGITYKVPAKGEGISFMKSVSQAVFLQYHSAATALGLEVEGLTPELLPMLDQLTRSPEDSTPPLLQFYERANAIKSDVISAMQVNDGSIWV